MKSVLSKRFVVVTTQVFHPANIRAFHRHGGSKPAEILEELGTLVYSGVWNRRSIRKSRLKRVLSLFSYPSERSQGLSMASAVPTCKLEMAMKAMPLFFLFSLLFMIGNGALAQSARQGALNTNDSFVTAALLGQTDTVEQMLEEGADINGRDRYNNTALTAASSQGHTATVRLLLGKGANPEEGDQSGDTALMCAARNGHVDTAKVLLEQRPSVGARNINQDTALIEAAGHPGGLSGNPPRAANYLAVVELLLDNGANVQAKNRQGITPIIWAAEWGNTEIVKLLLDRGANIEDADMFGNTALMRAAVFGRDEAVAVLVAKGAKLEAKDAEGKTALMHAAVGGPSGGHADTVELLLNEGANLEARDNRGETVLILMISENYVEGHTEALEALLTRGANVEAKDNQGDTALAKAISLNRADLVRVLKIHNQASH